MLEQSRNIAMKY